MVRIGDWPINTPATNAPKTVFTPIRLVINAITPMIARIAVMTGNSLSKLSLTNRITSKTSRLPMVKLAIRNKAVPITLLATIKKSIVAVEASPKVMEMMTQPIVSSMIEDEMITWPRLRLVKFMSWTTAATILIEEIDKAVPRNKTVSSRLSGAGNNESGSTAPSAAPQTKGTATPLSETLSAARPNLRNSCRSVSIPVSSSNKRIPKFEIAASMAFCSFSAGKSQC